MMALAVFSVGSQLWLDREKWMKSLGVAAPMNRRAPPRQLAQQTAAPPAPAPGPARFAPPPPSYSEPQISEPVWPEIKPEHAKVMTRIVGGRAYLRPEAIVASRLAIVSMGAVQVEPNAWQLCPLDGSVARAIDVIRACEEGRLPIAMTLTAAMLPIDVPVQIVAGEKALELAKPMTAWALWAEPPAEPIVTPAPTPRNGKMNGAAPREPAIPSEVVDTMDDAILTS
jgi:hypothetical protein